MARPVAIPLTVSLLLHLAIVVLLAFNLSFSQEPKVLPPQPKIIEATLVSMEQLPATRAQPEPVQAPVAKVAPPKPVEPPPKPEPPKPEPPKPEPQKPAPPKPELPKPEPIKSPEPDRKAEAEKQKQQEKIQLEKEKALALEKAEQQKRDAEKKEAEQKKAAEKQKQDAEKKRKEQEEADRKKQEDAARKQREQQERSELAKAMAAEDNALAAERDQEAVASYVGLITRDIQNNWSRPPNARVGMEVTLLIQLIPSGDVINVSVIKSSGNDAFDRSAENAVRRVGKFPYLRELAEKSSPAFERNFRRLTMVFNPTDLRQ